MTIKVKMKDVPWSEVKDHFRLPLGGNYEKVWEELIRGKEVELTGNTAKYSHINVIGYETTLMYKDENYWACSICAEIGD